MPHPLPPGPSLEHLRKEAKALLAAHHAGDPSSCERLRRLGRLASCPDASILSTPLTLADAQMAVALDYGFDGWADLKRHVETEHLVDARTPLGGSVCRRAIAMFGELQDDPLYQRSQIWTLMVALHALGRDDVDYATLMAVSGWSGQFVYHAKPDGPSFFEPYPTVARACRAIGVGFQQYTDRDADGAWHFIHEAIAADRPVLGEHYEYGLFVDAADQPRSQVRYFVVPFMTDGAWWTRPQFEETFWDAPGDKRLFRLTGPTEPPDPATVIRDTVAGLVHLASEDYWDGWRREAAPRALTGLAAIGRYAADIADPSKTMQNAAENDGECFFDRGWGCYAVYPQFTARECTGRYLDVAAASLQGDGATLLRRAAGRYHQAFGHWRQWEKHLGRDTRFGTYDERWAEEAHRAAGHRAVLAALDQEGQAIDLLRQALTVIPA